MSHDLDIVVRVSDRLILEKNWVAGLRELAMNTQYATYAAPCAHFNVPFRQELFAIHVPSWHAFVCSQMSGDIRAWKLADKTTDEAVTLEKYYIGMAKEVHRRVHPVISSVSHWDNVTYDDCDYTVRHEQYFPRPEDSSGYGVWPILGLARTQKVRGLLWKDSHTPADYYELSKSYGLAYTEADFG